MVHVLSGFQCGARSRRAGELGLLRGCCSAQRKRARPMEQRDVVTAFPALPAGTPIQLTAMSIGEGRPHPQQTLLGLLASPQVWSIAGAVTCAEMPCALSILHMKGPALQAMRSIAFDSTQGISFSTRTTASH